MNMFKLVPNFEMTMYLAQATGACIVTDSPFRWSEVKRAIRRRVTMATPGLATLSDEIKAAKFAFPQNVTDVVDHALKKTCAGYPDLLRDLFKYLSHLEERGAKPNRLRHATGATSSASGWRQPSIRSIIFHRAPACAFKQMAARLPKAARTISARALTQS